MNFVNKGSLLAVFVSEIRMNVLKNNPYRLLGVYTNSPTKERLANHNRMKAFLKVGKSVSFSLDLPQYLQPINRTDTLVADADAKLALPKDQMFYALFWFIKATPLDDIAFNHLIAGERSKAEEIWQKKETLSSLQNRIVCALMCDDYKQALSCTETLYANMEYVNQFVSAVIGTGGNVDVTDLPFTFLDALCEEIDVQKILPHIENSIWKKHISGKAINPLIDTIQNAIAIAKKSRGKGSQARLEAGEVLMKSTKATLQQLMSLLPKTDLQYQMIADKLGLEILQCGIDYYNESDDADAAHKAMKLQKYALKIVVGQMAKDRCKENVDILQKIIDNLPPSEVYSEDRAIHEELRKYCLLPDKICHAVTLLNNTRPHLQAIKRKLGVSNGYYLKISSQVVGNALSNAIAEVNASNNNDILKSAWELTLFMDTFDLEVSFKEKTYKKNREILKQMCEERGLIHRFSSKRASYWQAVLFLHIICVIIGYYIADESGYFDKTIFYWSIGIGAISWIYILIDKGEDTESYGGWLASSGCWGIIILFPLCIGYWIYKGIRFLLDVVKS
ncbi:hypothetical protein HMPREF9969_0776 [Prevotella sp. oral taxon 306 str. F0472]|uniref:hypothetical protein n=1 Tax=Prevotella sp. oral taxon 306 TaxID=712461 RepID=UPI00025BA056|nr:hypothetical protein [Prevotella sp. oral taxon 306]EID34648.1 hypothetical protein HMPREF9969_0776 [Prevotella sp. oral taxon 306 str. F0472]